MMDFASLGIRVDSSQVNTASRDLHSLSSAAGNAEASTSRLSSAARALGPVIGAIGFATLAHDMLKTIEQVQNLELRLKGLTKGAQDYAASQEYLSAVSVKHHKNLLDLTSSYAGLLAIEQTGVITRQQSKALLEGLSNVQSKTGASADALKSSVIGLNQALGMGTLQWEEMKQVTEPLPGLMMKIAEAAGYTGKSAIGDFKAVVSAGQVTSDMFGKIMVEALGQYQGAAEAAGGTLTAQYADVKNQWINLADALEAPVSDNLTPVLKVAAEQLKEISKFNAEAMIGGIVAIGEVATTVFAGQMLIGIGQYTAAKYAAINVEQAHAAAIAQNIQFNIAAADAQMAEVAATQAAIVAARESAIAQLPLVNAKIAQAQATIAATSATVQSTSVLYIHQQAVSALAVAEQQRSAVLAELSTLGAQQTRITIAASEAAGAQAAATAAQTAATVTFATSLKMLLNPINLVNIGLSAMVGWEIGGFLNKFETVRRVANDALYSILTGIENVTYYWDRFTSVMSGNSGQLDSLKAAHIAQQSIIDDLISDTNTYVVGVKQATNATESLTKATGKSSETAAEIRKEIEATAGTHKKAADSAIKDAQRKAEAIVKGIQDEMKALDDQHNKLTLSERDYYATTLASKGMSAAQKAMALAVWDSNKALDAQKTSNDKVKTEMESLADHYNQLTLSARDYYEAKLKADGITSDKSGPLLAQFDKNSAVEAQQRSIESARDSMQAYDDLIKQVNDSTGKLGATNQAVFDGALGGINTLVGVFQNMGESIKETTKQQEALNLAYAKQKDTISNNSGLNERQKFTLMLGKEADYLKANKKLERDKTDEALTGTRQMIAATARMFDEKSSAAKALHNLETGISIAQMAMRGAEMAKDIAATASSLAAGAAKMFSQSGWGGFAGVAAMGAVMAGLGYAAFGGGGGSSAKPVYSTDTGTVLGDSTAKSESIDKTYQLLKDIHADEYAELRGINRGIASLSTGITDVITRLFQAGGIKDFATLPTGKLTGISGMLTSIDPINKAGFDPIGKAVLGFLFGGKQTSTVTAQGISTGATSISDIMAGGNLTANQFATIETKTKGGLFGKDKTKYSEQYAALDEATQKSLNMVFSSMGDTMLGLAESLGRDTKQKVEGYIIPAMKVDLKGLSGEDAAKKLNGVISAALDTMSSAVFGGIIGQYQQLGEGMLETAVRIVSEVAVVKDALGKSGLSIAGDAIAISDALVQAAGGLQEFQKAFDDYYQKFYSESERTVFLQKNLSSQLGDLNTLLPTTRDGYRKLIEALDINNAADQQRYSLLIKLSGAADDYYKGLESAAEAALQIAKQQRALDIQLMELSGNAIGALTEKRKDELAAMDESLRFSQQAVWAMAKANDAVIKAQNDMTKANSDAITKATNDISKSISNLTALAGKLREALGSTVIETNASLRQDRLSANAVLNAALATARNGGSIENFPGMDKALKDIAKPSEKLYSTMVDYARDQGRTGNTISELASYTESQISIAQQQLDAIKGTTEAVLSVKDAVFNLDQAMKIRDDMMRSIETANYAIKAEASAKTTSDAATAKFSASSQAFNDAMARAETASSHAQIAQNKANQLANFAPAPATWQNGQSGNAIWEQVLSQFNAWHTSYSGKPMNRAWGSDADSWRAYQGLVTQYNQLSSNAAASAQAQANQAAALAASYTAMITGYQQTAAADQTAAEKAQFAYSTASAYAAAAKAAVPNIQGFATGGDHSGGWRVVGENGPELEYTPPSHIFSNSQSKSLVDNSDLIAELQALRNEVAMLRAEARATATHTNKSAKLLERAMPNGDSITVTVSA